MSKRKETEAKRELIDTARRMSEGGLSIGRSGNLSRRWDDGMLITPTGVDYAALTPGDVSFVDGSGEHRGGLKPSSEWRFHASVYRTRPDAHAVVHCHSRYATALACAKRKIPAFHYMVAVAGGDDIPLAPYATFGTEELAQHVSGALQHRKACLLAHHGQIATGRDLASALDLAFEVERLAAQYVAVLQMGEPQLIPADEMARVIERFSTYGQQTP